MSRSPLLPIFLTVFVDVLGLTLMLPLLPFYVTSFNATPLTVGILGATYSACQLVAGPILGRISDRVGRKPVLLVSQMGTFIAFLIIGGASSLWMLFVGRIIDGLTAGNLSIAQAYISDVTKPENRTRAFAVIGISFGIGFLFVPAASGMLAAKYGYALPAYVAAGLSFTSILLNARFLPGAEEVRRIREELGLHLAPGAGPPPPAGERSLAIGKFFTRPRTRRHMLQHLSFTLSFAVLMGGLALFLHERFDLDVKGVGYVLMASGMMGVLIQGGLIRRGRLVNRFGETRVALFGFISMAAGYPLLGLTSNIPQLIGVVCFSAFGVGVVRPCVTTLITKSVPHHEQGEALGTAQSLQSIAQIVGQPIAGFLITQHQLFAYGAAAGAFALGGIVLTLMPLPLESADVVQS